MSKGEEIFREAMGVSLREGYPVLTEDHPFFKNLSRFMSGRSHWLGTASDLVNEMHDTVQGNVQSMTNQALPVHGTL